MENKDLMRQTPCSVNSVTEQNLPADFVELSEKELSQVTGGWVNYELWVLQRRRAIEGFLADAA